ncbi:MAG: hypothetical protein AB7F43_06290 [Bacteriovoracia bacterium]
MSRKNKFDLSHLVHEGYLNEGDKVFFVSNPDQCATVKKAPNGEFKLQTDGSKEFSTVHAFAQKCLGQEPPNHASCWLRTASGKTLYELWQGDLAQAA